MIKRQKFELFMVVTFCMFLANGFVLSPALGAGAGEMHFPYHRYLMIIVAIIFIINFRQLSLIIKQNALIFLLPIYVLTTSLWAGDLISVIKAAIFLMATILLGIGTAAIFVRRPAYTLSIISIFLTVLVLISAYVIRFSPGVGIDILNFDRPRWVGITSHPNSLGVLCMLTIWCNMSLIVLYRSKIIKILSIMAIVISGLLLYGADSKTSIVGSIALCMTAFYVHFKQNRAARSLLIVATFILFSIFLLKANFFSAENAELVTGREMTLTGRAIIWKHAIDSIILKPIGGWGFDHLDVLTKRFRIEMSHLHNGYLELVVKGGFITLVLFAIYGAITIKRLFAIEKVDKKSYLILTSGIIMVLVHNFAESTMLRGFNPLWITMVLLYFTVGIRSSHDAELSPDRAKTENNNNSILLKRRSVSSKSILK